jgi:hypothetical protein
MTSVVIRNYVSILEEIEHKELFESNLSIALNEGLGDKALVGFLKIVKTLWDAGWYTVGHPVKAAKKVYQVGKTTAKAGLAVGAAGATGAGLYYAHPLAERIYILWQYAGKISDAVSASSITNMGAIVDVLAQVKHLPSLMSWDQDPVEKAEILKKLGISDDVYTDALVKVFELASRFAIDNMWVILALGISMLAARRLGKLVSDRIQSKIDSLSTTNTQNTSNSGPDPTQDNQLSK